MEHEHCNGTTEEYVNGQLKNMVMFICGNNGECILILSLILYSFIHQYTNEKAQVIIILI